MRPTRVLALLLLAAAELATLAAIVLVLRSSIGADGLGWNGVWGVNVGGPAQAREERFVPLAQPLSVLHLYNDAGKVEVRTGANDFGVRAVVYGYGWSEESAKESLKQVHITTSTDANGTRIEAKGPQHVTGSRPRADLFVTIPAGVTVKVNAGMGSVDLRNVIGNADIEASMGRVDVEGFEGNITVNARMGRVDLDYMEIKDLLDVRADMGAISFRGNLGKKNTISASMGSITLDLEDDHPALRLDADWSMGSFNSDLPIDGSRQDKSAKGTLGEGVAIGDLRLHASMGSIRIRK